MSQDPRVERLTQYQKRWPKGHSGNLAGRPKYKEFYRHARRWLSQVDPQTQLTNIQMTVAAIGEAAKKGNVFAARELRSWAEGTSDALILSQINTQVTINSAKEKLFSKLVSMSNSNGDEPGNIRQRLQAAVSQLSRGPNTDDEDDEDEELESDERDDEELEEGESHYVRQPLPIRPITARKQEAAVIVG
jgi:hypothetical protein